MKLTSLRPMLESRNLETTIEFYTGTLGFTVGDILQDGETTSWCSLYRDGVSIMFCSPNTHMNYGGILLTGSIYFNVEEVDRIWEDLKDKCSVLYNLENFNYGMREFGIKDNNGYVLSFGEPVSK